MIKLYRINNCHWCDKAEEFLKETKKEIVIIDIDSDPSKKEEMLSIAETLTVPVVDIDGKIFIGYNKRLMCEAIYGYTW